MDDFIGNIYQQNCGDSLLVIKETQEKRNGHILFFCVFQKYPYEILALKGAIKSGEVINPRIEEEEFIKKIWPQNCGDSLKIIKKQKNLEGRWEYLCQFIKYPFFINAYGSNIKRGKVYNPQIERNLLINKKFLQNWGENLIIKDIIFKPTKKYLCYFENYPNKEIFLSSITDIKKGKISNSYLEGEDIIGKIYIQTYGEKLLVLNSTKQKNSGGHKLFLCKFLDYNCEVLATRGEICKRGVYNPALPWRKKELLENFINKYFSNPPTLFELSNKLNISVSELGRCIREFKLEDKIDYFCGDSLSERTLRNYIIDIYPLTDKESNWDILDGKEIDIYIPNKKLGIEYNGNYWHSELFKDKNYHQEKSLLAQKKGINLIHIFEYEWLNKEEIIKSLIKFKLGIFDKKIGARNCIIKELDYKTYADFCNKNHLEGECGPKIKLGLFYKEELVQIMSFGSPRFTYEYQWEIIRECSKLDYCIIGGKEKLWKYFIKKYSPSSVISYCDFSKFIGNSYLNLGFKQIRLNKPGFVWWDNKGHTIFWRDPYHNQEMKEKGYSKIWDCGQLVFEWNH